LRVPLEGKPPIGTGIDHIILGINNLDRGIAWIEQITGVRAIFGGVHPGHGTQNALLALGEDCYLEIMAPDPRQSAPTWFTQILTLNEPRLIGWAVHTSNLSALARVAVTAGLAVDGPYDGARTRPGGDVLSWKLFRLRDDWGGLLPLFLDWGNSTHPAHDLPQGCRLVNFHLQSPQPEDLAGIFKSLSVKVDVEQRNAPRMSARIASPRGEVDLAS
jgi:hypothetical protein